MKKLLAKVKGWGARVSIKRTGLIIVAVGALLSVAFLYKELSSMRRDLYAVRADYYTEPTQEEYHEPDYQPPTVEILNQSVKNLRIQDLEKSYTEQYPDIEYKKQAVREVLVRIKNNFEYVYSTGNYGHANSKGVIQRPITVHPSDDQNNLPNKGYYTVELAPGGETTLYFYFADEGTPIEKLLDLDNMGF